VSAENRRSLAQAIAAGVEVVGNSLQPHYLCDTATQTTVLVNPELPSVPLDISPPAADLSSADVIPQSAEFIPNPGLSGWSDLIWSQESAIAYALADTTTDEQYDACMQHLQVAHPVIYAAVVAALVTDAAASDAVPPVVVDAGKSDAVPPVVVDAAKVDGVPPVVVDAAAAAAKPRKQRKAK